MTALYQILLRTSISRGRVLAFVAGGALLDLIAYSIRVSDYANREVDTFQLLDVAAVALYVPVVVLVFATSSLGDLAQDGTLVYVWLRPVASWKVVIVALAATLSITLPLTLIPSWLAVVLAGAGTGTLWAITASVALANLAYAALFTGFGLRVRHALIFGLGYVVIWEAGIASLGKGPAAISIRHYAESLFAHVANQAVPAGADAETALWPSVIVLFALFVVGIAITSVLFERQDVA
jgi:ABC-2 type transport system permease protein